MGKFEKIVVLAGTGIEFSKLLGELGLVECLEDRLDAGWLLGMPESGVVLLVCEVGDEDGFHGESLLINRPCAW